MKNQHRLVFTALLIAGPILGLPACNKSASKPPVSFAAEVKPLIEARCVNCHHAGALLGNLNLENREMAFRERPTGPVIILGDPDKSPFYRVLTLPEGDKKAMPPTGHRIPPEEMSLLHRWILQGATWPTGPDGVITPTVTLDPKGV